MIFSHLSETKMYLESHFSGKQLQKDNWSPYKTFVHCAQTINYAIDGYPEYKPVFIQNTVGKLAIRKFLKQGFMKHNLQAPVPGAPVISDDGDTEAGLATLFSAIDRFIAYTGKLKKHLLFGTLDKQDYDTYFCMHIADHLTEFK